jgi:hypothetical protein
VSTRKLVLVLAAASTVVLATMTAVSISTGVSQEPHQWYEPPAAYAQHLLADPGTLRLVFGLDVGFLVLYTALFAALASYLRELGRPFVTLALVAMLGTAVVDIVEDHHIVTMLDQALHGQLPSDAQIVFEQVVSSSKFTLSYISLVLFGLAIPRDRKLGIALCLFLTVGTIVTAVLVNATGEAMRAQNAHARGIGFLIGFVLIIAWLRGQPDDVSRTTADT